MNSYLVSKPYLAADQILTVFSTNLGNSWLVKYLVKSGKKLAFSNLFMLFTCGTQMCPKK